MTTLTRPVDGVLYYTDTSSPTSPMSSLEIALVMSGDGFWPQNFNPDWLVTEEGFIDMGPGQAPIPWIEVPARIFEAGIHANPEPIPYPISRLDLFIANFYALPEPIDWLSWRRPAQVDHGEGAMQTVGSIRELWRVGEWLWGRIRYIGQDIVWRVKTGLFRKLSLGHTGDSIDEITVTPFAFLEEAQAFSKEDPMALQLPAPVLVPGTPVSTFQTPPATPPVAPNPLAGAQHYSLQPPVINVNVNGGQAPATPPPIPAPESGQFGKSTPSTTNDENGGSGSGAGYSKNADGTPRRFMDESDADYATRSSSYITLAPAGGSGNLYSRELENLRSQVAAQKTEVATLQAHYAKEQGEKAALVNYTRAKDTVTKYFNDGRVHPSAYEAEIEMVAGLSDPQVASYCKAKDATTPELNYGRISNGAVELPGGQSGQADIKAAGKALGEKYAKAKATGDRPGL